MEAIVKTEEPEPGLNQESKTARKLRKRSKKLKRKSVLSKTIKKKRSVKAVKREEEETDKEYEVEHILQEIRLASGERQFFISWKGYSAKHNLYVSEADCVSGYLRHQILFRSLTRQDPVKQKKRGCAELIAAWDQEWAKKNRDWVESVEKGEGIKEEATPKKSAKTAKKTRRSKK